jgi:hypothetical protein
MQAKVSRQRYFSMQEPQPDPPSTSTRNNFDRKVKVSSTLAILIKHLPAKPTLSLLCFTLSAVEEPTVEPVEFTELVANTVEPHVNSLSNVHKRGMIRVPEKGVRVEPKVGPVVVAQRRG